MKKIAIFLALLFGSLFFIGCTNQQLEPSAYEDVNNLDGVELFILEDSILPTGLTTQFLNETDTEFTFGQPYELEIKVDNEWYKVPIATDENYGFEDIGFILPPHDSATWDVDWEWLYGELEPGKYRIIKDILDVYEGGGYDDYILAAEFEIQ